MKKIDINQAVKNIIWDSGATLGGDRGTLTTAEVLLRHHVFEDGTVDVAAINRMAGYQAIELEREGYSPASPQVQTWDRIAKWAWRRL